MDPLARGAPARHSAVLLDVQRRLQDFDLLHDPRRGRHGLEGMPAGGATVQAVFLGAAGERLGRQQGALVMRVAGLPAHRALRLVGRRRWLGRLYQIGRRWLGGGGGILAQPGQSFLELPDGALQSFDLGLQGGHLLLQAMAVRAGVLAPRSQDAPLYEPAKRQHDACGWLRGDVAAAWMVLRESIAANPHEGNLLFRLGQYRLTPAGPRWEA